MGVFLCPQKLQVTSGDCRSGGNWLAQLRQTIIKIQDLDHREIKNKFVYYVYLCYICIKKNKNMGQYYKPMILKPQVKNKPEKIKAWMQSYDFGNGSKLMEHSYLGNDFVQTFEFQLSPEGQHHKSRVVWGGDYADEEMDQVAKHEEEDGGEEYNPTLYSLCEDEMKMTPRTKKTEKYPFIINHTKKQFVDKRKVPNHPTWGEGYEIHPLPLLTCEGNGRGGGDFRGESDIIGSWSRNVISVEQDVPTGFKELKFDLVE